MAVYIVTWDMNDEADYRRSRQHFMQLFDQIEQTHDPQLRTVRFVSTSSTAEELRDFLRSRLDETDRIIVTQLRAHECAWYMQSVVGDWINARIAL